MKHQSQKKVLVWGLGSSMENKDLHKKSAKIIKIDQNLRKNDGKTPNFICRTPKIVEANSEEYMLLDNTQKFKLTLNYVIKLLHAKMISVDDALNLLMNLI